MDTLAQARLKVDELSDLEVIEIFSEVGNRCLHGEQAYNDIHEIFEEYSIEEMQELLYNSVYNKKLNTSDDYFVVDMNYITSFKNTAYCREMIKAHMSVGQALDILHRTASGECKKAYEYIEYLTENQIANVYNELDRNIMIVPNTPKAIYKLECEFDLNSENIYTTLINDKTYDRKDMYLVFYKDDGRIESMSQYAIGDGYMDHLVENMDSEIANKIIKEYERGEDVVRF